MPGFVEYDFLRPSLDPSDLCAYLSIKSNYLGHEVQVTIGQPTLPPKKRGQAAGYSGLDGMRIQFGRRLIAMGITPSRVKTCVSVIQTPWNDIAPDNFDVDREMLGSDRPNDPYFLYGTEDSRGFFAVTLTKDELQKKLGSLKDGYPHLIQNITTFYWIEALNLLRVLKERCKLDRITR